MLPLFGRTVQDQVKGMQVSLSSTPKANSMKREALQRGHTMTLFSIKALRRNWLCLFLSVTGPGLVGERLVAGADSLPPLPPAADRAVDFVRDIQPIFAK